MVAPMLHKFTPAFTISRKADHSGGHLGPPPHMYGTISVITVTARPATQQELLPRYHGRHLVAWGRN